MKLEIAFNVWKIETNNSPGQVLAQKAVKPQFFIRPCSTTLDWRKSAAMNSQEWNRIPSFIYNAAWGLSMDKTLNVYLMLV